MITWGSVDLDKALISGASFDAVVGAMGIPAEPLGNAAAASINLNGTSDVALGANLGVMYDINDQWTAGVNFRTRMGMKVGAGMARVSYANSPGRECARKQAQPHQRIRLRSLYAMSVDSQAGSGL